MTDIILASGSWTTLRWFNDITDQQNFYNSGAYRVDKRSNLNGVLSVNINVSCSVNNMPGTLSANGTWQIRVIETGSSTPYSTRAIPAYINFFDQLQQSRTGGINTTYELASEFILNDIPVGNYYFQIRQSPNSATPPLPLVTLDPKGTTKSFLEIKEVKSAADGRIMDIPSNMPFGTTGIKQIEFILVLQKKFNLVIYPDKTKPNQFVIETFDTWYGKGERKDFNKYINLDEIIEVIPANNLAVNQLNFGDTLDEDYLSQQFAKGANREYAKSYYTDTTNFYSQGELNVETTFASSPLLQIQGTGLSGSIGGITPVIIAYSIGQCKFTPQFDPLSTCTSGILISNIYTLSGTFGPGIQLYLDEYGQSKVSNFRFVVNGTSGPIYSLSSDGIVGSITGQFC
jgi:hypothetical protein